APPGNRFCKIFCEQAGGASGCDVRFRCRRRRNERCGASQRESGLHVAPAIAYEQRRFGGEVQLGSGTFEQLCTRLATFTRAREGRVVWTVIFRRYAGTLLSEQFREPSVNSLIVR